MKVATAAYPMDFLSSWAEYAAKIEAWVSEAAGQGAELLVFPEWGSMEIATLAGREAAYDLQGCIAAISERIGDVDGLHSDLASKYGVHILAASANIYDAALGGRPVNRARLFAPTGGAGFQDKQIMTRFEREEFGVVPGQPLKLFDTALGRIGILVCYDAEFPLLGRAQKEADIILVPACTEALMGYWRVRIGAMARALEGQCITVMASTVGACDWSYAVDTNCGMGGVFCPPDKGFPPSGVLSEGTLDVPGWTYADIDLAAIEEVRRDGVVLNRSHWDDQAGRDHAATVVSLR